MSRSREQRNRQVRGSAPERSKPRETKRFAIAVSFPGEHRRFVLKVVERLAEELGRDRVFYDEWYEAELAGQNGDLKLKRYYRELGEMVVPFFSEHYKKPWCNIEWHAIRAMLMERRREDAVVPVEMDVTKIDGWERIDFAIRRKNRTAREIGDLILEAYQLRHPEPPVIAKPPRAPDDHFTNREEDYEKIARFLASDRGRVLTIVGRQGMGKTSLVCKLLDELNRNRGSLPSTLPDVRVDRCVYVPVEESGTRPTLARLYDELCSLLEAPTANEFRTLERSGQVRTVEKIAWLLDAFPLGCWVAMLDNFESLVDDSRGTLQDAELAEALKTVLTHGRHRVKLILMCHREPAPPELRLVSDDPDAYEVLYLDKLPFPHAGRYLRGSDNDEANPLGLKNATEKELQEAWKATSGFPYLLAKLVGYLRSDRGKSLSEVLEILPKGLWAAPALLGGIFERLGDDARRVWQALAIYDRPVSAEDVERLLAPYLPHLKSRPILGRLVNLLVVQTGNRSGPYSVEQVDRDFLLGLIERGKDEDRNAEPPPFTKIALYHRAAEHFLAKSEAFERWRETRNVDPQLAAIQLYFAGGDYDHAAEVLDAIAFHGLIKWGQCRRTVEEYERLRGKIQDPKLKRRSLRFLGLAYRNLGEAKAAQSCLSEALAGLREPQALSKEDLKEKRSNIHLLGDCYWDTCDTERAIECFQEALLAHEEAGDTFGMAVGHENLGDCYADLGKTSASVDCYTRAIEVARLCMRENPKCSEARVLAGSLRHLGGCYDDLGDVEKAWTTLKKALRQAQDVNEPATEARTLADLAQVSIAQFEYPKAEKQSERGVEISQKIHDPVSCVGNLERLASAYLFDGKLGEAAAEARKAVEYNLLRRVHACLALQGVIALRQGRNDEAGEAFDAAIVRADEILRKTPQFFRALDSKGIAFSGLAILHGSEDLVEDAVDAHRAARKINSDRGITSRLLLLYDELRKAKPRVSIEPARAAADGR